MEDKVINYIEKINGKVKEFTKNSNTMDMRNLLDLVKFIREYIVFIAYEDIYNDNKHELKKVKDEYINSIKAEISTLEEELDNLIKLADSNKVCEICNIQNEIKELNKKLNEANSNLDISSLVPDKKTMIHDFIIQHGLSSILNENYLLNNNKININGVRVALEFAKGNRRQYEIASTIRANSSHIVEDEYLLTKLSNYKYYLRRALDEYNANIKKYMTMREKYVRINKNIFKSKQEIAFSNKCLIIMYDCLKNMGNIEVIPGFEKLFNCPFLDMYSISINMNDIEVNIYYESPKPIIRVVKDKFGVKNEVLEFHDTNMLNINFDNIDTDNLVDTKRNSIDKKKKETKELSEELITDNLDDIFNFEQILNFNPKILKYFLEALELLSEVENSLFVNKLMSAEERTKIEENVKSHIKTLTNKYNNEIKAN